jgi:hypothetical protein
MQIFRVLLSKSAAAIVAAAGLFGVPLGIVYAYTSFVEDAQTRLNNAETLRARLVAEASGQTDPSQLKALAEAHGAEFLKDEPESVVLAELQSMIRAFAAGERSELASARTLTTKTKGTLVYLGLKVEIIGPYDGIQSTLLKIENTKPQLFVERAILNVFDPSGQVAAGLEQPRLRAELDIYGARSSTLAHGVQIEHAIPTAAEIAQ